MFKEVFKILISLFLIWGMTACTESYTARCVKVSDGDTIKVRLNGSVIKVRLHGIDCPELNQGYGRKARDFAEKMVLGKSVVLNVADVDQYGRTVADVMVGGVSLNLELVKNGLAWHYVRHSDSRELADAEKYARKEKKGLWRGKNPIPPWKYRKKKRR